MPNRPGDKDITERINEGEVDLSKFFPENSDSDMVTAINKSAMRQSIYFDRRLRPSHTDSSREGDVPRYLMQAASVPNYVINIPISVDGRKWEYKTPVSSQNLVNLRRVFIERNQAIELSVGVTLEWLSAGQGSAKHETMKSLLEEEVAIPGNEVIMQLMYQRIKSTPVKSMIDGAYTVIPYGSE